MMLLESICGLRYCSVVVGIDQWQEVRFDRQRCDSCDSGAYQASPALYRSLCEWVGGFLHVRAWYGGWVVAFWLMGFGWRYGRLGWQWCLCRCWCWCEVVWVLVGVV